MDALESFVKSYDEKIYNLITNWIFDASKSTVSNGHEISHLQKRSNFLKLLLQKIVSLPMKN